MVPNHVLWGRGSCGRRLEGRKEETWLSLGRVDANTLLQLALKEFFTPNGFKTTNGNVTQPSLRCGWPHVLGVSGAFKKKKVKTLCNQTLRTAPFCF